MISPEQQKLKGLRSKLKYEQDELLEKIGKLETFIANQRLSQTLTNMECTCLLTKYNAMTAYHSVLMMQIGLVEDRMCDAEDSKNFVKNNIK